MAQLDLSEILDTVPYAVFIKDSQHRWVYGNAAFRELIGDDFLGKDDRDLFGEEQVQVFWREDARVFAGEESLNEEEIGENRFAITKKVPFKLPDGTTGLLGIIIDYIATSSGELDKKVPAVDLGGFEPQMTALKRRLEEALREKNLAIEVAYTDAATGLRNRHGLEADLARQIAVADQTGRPFALALLDLDNFKRINDRFGHAAGDEVLKVIGRRLKEIPSVISVGRIGGDEFAIITEKIDQTDEARNERLERLRQIIFRPIFAGDRELQISGSAGVCIYPADASTGSELLSRADMALFSAKRSDQFSAKIFDSATLVAYQRRIQIEEKLPEAIRNGDIVPVYQPIVSSTTRRAVGVEVLARWHNEDLGLVSPDEFISTATDIGVIGKLDRAIFSQAMRDTRAWLENGQIDFVSLNASPMDVVSPGYAADFLRRLKEAGISPDHICLEILESSIVEDVSSARRNLGKLRDAGVEIALDDYGTGYSNLRALLDMPLDKLKIDKSLVWGIEKDDKVLDLVISLVQLGRALELTTVAEGVETNAQSAFIEGAGCPELQGYLFCKPQSRAALDEWFATQAPAAEGSGESLKSPV